MALLFLSKVQVAKVSVERCQASAEWQPTWALRVKPKSPVHTSHPNCRKPLEMDEVSVVIQ